jgi:hypothetical protein
MSMEYDLGTLIRKCSPYGGGAPLSMHFGHDAPPPRQEIQAAAEAVAAGRDEPQIENLARFHPEIQNYPGEWIFMGDAYRVTKAVRIPYRYPLRDKDGNLTGVFATLYLLIGYTGGNGP